MGEHFLMKATVRIRGLPELKVELSRLSAAVAGRLSRNAAMAGARVVARHAKLLAPVGETGDLRRSIRAHRDPDWRQSGRRTALAGSRLFYSRFVELGTSRMPARSFLRAAADEAAGEVRSKIEENLSRGIEVVSRRWWKLEARVRKHGGRDQAARSRSVGERSRVCQPSTRRMVI